MGSKKKKSFQTFADLGGARWWSSSLARSAQQESPGYAAIVVAVKGVAVVNYWEWEQVPRFGITSSIRYEYTWQLII